MVLPPHSTEIFHCSGMTCSVTMVIHWRRAFSCSFNLSQNVLEDSPVYSSLHSTLSHLYLCMMPDIAWWLSHCKYCSLYIGFLKTIIIKLPSDCGMTKVSRKGIGVSARVFSALNFMPSSWRCYDWKKYSLCVDFMTTKVSSTNLFHRLWGWGDVLRALASSSSYISRPLWDLLVIPLLHPLAAHSISLGILNMCVFIRQIGCITMDVLCWISLSVFDSIIWQVQLALM